MHIRTIAGSVLIIFLAVIIYSPLCFSLSLINLLTVFAVTLGILFAIWIHILLSSRYKTGIGIDPVHKELERFRNKLLVYAVHYVFQSNLTKPF